MLGVAAKMGVGFVLILIFMGMIESHSVASPVLLFMTAGLVPAVDIQVPAEVMLVLTGMLCMVVTVVVHRMWLSSHLALQAVLPDYQQMHTDPPYADLVPGLSGALAVGSAIQLVARETTQEFYMWLRSLGRPIIGQSISMREGFRTTLVRVDRRILFGSYPHEILAALRAMLRTTIQKVQAYLVRLTLF